MILDAADCCYRHSAVWRHKDSPADWTGWELNSWKGDYIYMEVDSTAVPPQGHFCSVCRHVYSPWLNTVNSNSSASYLSLSQIESESC